MINLATSAIERCCFLPSSINLSMMGCGRCSVILDIFSPYSAGRAISVSLSTNHNTTSIMADLIISVKVFN
jgi:hypothetical protein